MLEVEATVLSEFLNLGGIFCEMSSSSFIDSSSSFIDFFLDLLGLTLDGLTLFVFD